jgi:hypothetical protein
MIVSTPLKILRHGTVVLGLTALTAALGGCSHSAQEAAPSRFTRSAPKPSKDTKGVDPDMVSAVNLAGSATNLISMRFKLAARPQATMPLQVILMLTPAADTQVDRVQLTITPGDGLLLQSSHVMDLTDFHPNTPVQQDITVVPQQNGLLTVNATILVNAEGQSITRTYTIPLIVADTHG